MVTPEAGMVSEKRRRNRKPKACRTCRSRKVRCDYQQPCGTCVRRQHPQLCVYDTLRVKAGANAHAVTDSPASRRPSGDSAPPSPSEQELEDGVDNSPTLTDNSPPLPGLLAVLDDIAVGATESCETDSFTGQATFVGRNSSAALFRALLPHLPVDVLPPDVSVEAAFGLTNRKRSHPFATLWNTTVRVTLGDILRSLPPADTCLRYYRCYQQIARPFFPFLPDTEAFERNLCAVLDQLGADGDAPRPFSTRLAADVPLSELARYAVLFAVLASGCQFCDANDSEQLALTSRVFVACSFECLRLANFYVTPSRETIQATLILESVTCNDSNPGVCYGMLGFTARSAQSLGLHTKSDDHSSTSLCLGSLQPLWRAIIFLDSTLSMAYDQMPVSFISKNDDLLEPLVRASKLQFWDCMFNLHCLQVRWQTSVSYDTRTLISVDTVESYLEHAIQLGKSARSFKSSLCRPESIQATLEQLVFTIHLNRFEGSLHCQSAMATTLPEESRRRHFHDMTLKFCSVIDAYLKLRRLSPIAKIAWDIFHAVMSSALLLAAFECVLQSDFSGQLLHQLSSAFSHSSTLEEAGDDVVPMTWRPGCDTLERLLQFDSLRTPATAN